MFWGVSHDGTAPNLSPQLFFTLPPLNRLHSGDFQTMLLGDTKQMTSTAARISNEPVVNMIRTSRHTESRKVEVISRWVWSYRRAQWGIVVTNISLVLTSQTCLTSDKDTLLPESSQQWVLNGAVRMNCRATWSDCVRERKSRRSCIYGDDVPIIQHAQDN